MNNLNLHFLGSGDAFGSGGRFNTCFYVTSHTINFLIDCGATAVVALKKYGLSTEDIDVIVLTHFHGDHYGGLPFFLVDAGKVVKRTKPLTIVSPPGCRSKLKELIELLYPGASDVLDELDLHFIEYTAHQPVEAESLKITAYPVIHAEAVLPHALRIQVDNKIIAFSGDTEWTDELLDVARDADLFICECNYYKKESKGHLNYQTILKKRDKLSCKRFVLTHFNEEMLENLENVAFECAKDGKVIPV
jgi:ribonuclease BN (tRNA processing enzyme)